MTPPLADLTGRDDVDRLVRAFYREVAQDELLGPIFAGMEVDWPAHIDKLTDFWSWQLFGERGYEGNPLLAHAPVDARFPFATEHYVRWLDLFVLTVDALFAGSVADAATFRAAKMAHALQRLLQGISDRGDVAVSAPLVGPPPRR